MADREDLRQRINDLPKYKYDTKTGDGTATKFQVSKYPIEPATGTIVVGGSSYGTAGYSLNGTSGMLVFGTAPTNGTTIEAEYTCTQLNGTLLDDVLTRHSSVLELSAAECLEIRAAGAADYFSFISGDVRVDKKGISKAYLDLAKQLRENYYAPERQPTIDTQVEWEYMDQERVED